MPLLLLLLLLLSSLLLVLVLLRSKRTHHAGHTKRLRKQRPDTHDEQRIVEQQ